MSSTTLTTILAFVIVLGVLVSVHEVGHFSMAKLFKVRVFEFALGFPPRLFGFRRGDTLYAVNLIPLGGYVRMMGENGTDSDHPESFGYKPWWQRGMILLAGPVMNILLAVILFFAASAWLGMPVATNTIGVVQPNSPALRAGLRTGDTIVKVDGKNVSTYDQFHAILTKRVGQRVSITVRRGGNERTVNVVPRRSPPAGQGPVGFGVTSALRTYSAGNSLGMSLDQIRQTVMVIPNLIGGLVQHQSAPGVTGPIGIARYTGAAAMSVPQRGAGGLVGLVALISASLGIFNLLPIPALDGGRIVFVAISAVRRKRIDPQVEGMVHLVGMATLLLLVALVSYRDIVSWASGP